MAQTNIDVEKMAAQSAALLDAVRQHAPLVQCITNYVSMDFAANVLLAMGASPAMVHAEEEAGEFASFCAALTINIGTLSSPWLAGMRLAASAAKRANTPWVLDPVAHHATTFRRNAIQELLALTPTIIRGNASEIIALAGGKSTSRGVDSKDSVAQAEACAVDLARKHAAVVAVTGEVDFVTDGQQALYIMGGSPWMPQVTAMGCALTCLVGAFAAVSPGAPFPAVVAALSCFAIAGEAAGQEANGPGSFSWRFLDALASLSPESMSKHMTVASV